MLIIKTLLHYSFLHIAYTDVYCFKCINFQFKFKFKGNSERKIPMSWGNLSTAIGLWLSGLTSWPWPHHTSPIGDSTGRINVKGDPFHLSLLCFLKCHLKAMFSTKKWRKMTVVLETSHQKRHCRYLAILNSVFLTLAIGRMATVWHFTKLDHSPDSLAFKLLQPNSNGIPEDFPVNIRSLLGHTDQISHT